MQTIPEIELNSDYIPYIIRINPDLINSDWYLKYIKKYRTPPNTHILDFTGVVPHNITLFMKEISDFPGLKILEYPFDGNKEMVKVGYLNNDAEEALEWVVIKAKGDGYIPPGWETPHLKKFHDKYLEDAKANKIP